MTAKFLPENLPPISYGIREIVQKGRQLEEAGYEVNWENIGDPVNKGLLLPDWIIEIIHNYTRESASYAYCDSKGYLPTRSFLADKTNRLGGIQINENDITFFNGLGDAITTIYSLFSRDARVLQPSPTYPAHSSAERLRIHTEPLTYRCDPQNGWRPDLKDIRAKVVADKNIRAILVINPDNPTGTVHTREDLRAIVDIAREFNLLIIADEIYENVVYEGRMTRLSEVIGTDVMGIAMKGISKEFPWPGSRCGWVEYYNRKSDSGFDDFCTRIDQYKMSEVCSTTLPQMVIPKVMRDSRYPALMAERNNHYKNRMNLLHSYLSDIDGLTISDGGGGFYAVITVSGIKPEIFDELKPEPGRQAFFDKWAEPSHTTNDKLAFWLLAGYGICVVPLHSFNSKLTGFRMTLLEKSDHRFEQMIQNLRQGTRRILNIE